MKMNNTLKNKKALGFGKLFLIFFFVMFGLTLFLWTAADQQINRSVGTEELDAIDSTNLEFYYFDSMRLASTNNTKKLADYSFIDKENPDCLTVQNFVVLTETCKPDKEALKLKSIENFKAYLEKSLKGLELNKEVTCSFKKQNEMDYLNCYSEEMNLSSQRGGDFFSYQIYRVFRLNETINFDEELNLSEIYKVYQQALLCQNENCEIYSHDWKAENVKKEGNYLFFSLKTKKVYPFEEKTDQLTWNFSVKL